MGGVSLNRDGDLHRTTAQVACEAIVNHPDEGWELDTMRTVLADAMLLGVPRLYVSMLADLVAERAQEGGG